MHFSFPFRYLWAALHAYGRHLRHSIFVSPFLSVLWCEIFVLQKFSGECQKVLTLKIILAGWDSNENYEGNTQEYCDEQLRIVMLQTYLFWKPYAGSRESENWWAWGLHWNEKKKKKINLSNSIVWKWVIILTGDCFPAFYRNFSYLISVWMLMFSNLLFFHQSYAIICLHQTLTSTNGRQIILGLC